MSRERFIDPRIWRSESFQALSLGARLTCIGLIVTADDHGRGRGSPRAIQLEVWPGGDASIKQVEGWMKEVALEYIVRFYKVNGVAYYDIPNWDKYQYPKYKATSKIPAFSAESGEILYISTQNLPRTFPDVPGISQILPDHLPRGGDGRGEVGSGVEGMGGERDGETARSALNLEEQVARFNSQIAPLLRCGRIRGLSKAREAHLKKRLEEMPDLWDQIEAEAPRTAAKFLGDPTVKDSIRFIDFDWLVRSPDNLNKFLEGKYRKIGEAAYVRPQPTAEEIAAAYVPPPGSPRGWVEPPADTS